MVAATKFNQFVEYLSDKLMDLFGSPIGDTLKVMLVNSPAPLATNSLKADLTEIAAGNGYSAGGTAVPTNNGTRASGTVTVVGDQVVFTASGGAIGPFRYVVLYDDTVGAPAKPLIVWWDIGSAITLNATDTFTVKFSGAASGGAIWTLA